MKKLDEINKQLQVNNQTTKAGGNELLRARALEAARSEIKELREIDEERTHHCQKIESINAQLEQTLKRERQERQE